MLVPEMRPWSAHWELQLGFRECPGLPTACSQSCSAAAFSIRRGWLETHPHQTHCLRRDRSLFMLIFGGEGN